MEKEYHILSLSGGKDSTAFAFFITLSDSAVSVIFALTPTTSYPCFKSSNAVTLLSIPPDRATAAFLLIK